jgi:phosphate-selective porin OprO/OprP
MNAYETARAPRCRQGKPLRAKRTEIHFARGSLAVVLLLLSQTLSSIPANATQALGEIEEPGQVERRPAENSDAASRKSAASDPDPDPEPDTAEATTILPDSEAIDPTIGEEASARTDSESDETAALGAQAADESRDAIDEIDPNEATTIMPDSEAVDESIEEEEAPLAKESGAESPSTPEPPATPQWSIRWQNAFIVERVDDPRYQFLFGGRIQNDWGGYAPDSDLKQESNSGEGTGTKFRRARLYFQGQFFRFGFFKAEYDFSDGDNGTAFADVYAGLNLPKLGLLRVGYFKEPFSLQFQNSSNFISFNERAGSNALNPERNSGIMLNGNFLIRDSTYAVAFMRRTDDIGEGFSSKEDYHLTARVTGLPYFEDGGKRLLHIELGYSHQFADKNEGTRYQQRPGNDFAPNLVDTGAMGVDNVELFNAGLAIVEGAYSLQGEVTVNLPHGGISEDPVFWGAYAELSWWITGESRRYLRGRGVFSRVVPKNRFDPEKGRWGAFGTALRYSWLDLSNDGIRGGTLSEWSVALNWVLFSNMRVSTNYVFSHVRDRGPTSAGPRPDTESGFAHSLVTRIEVDF